MPGAKSAFHTHAVVHTLTPLKCKVGKCGIHEAGLLSCIVMISFWITLFVAIICLWNKALASACFLLWISNSLVEKKNKKTKKTIFSHKHISVFEEGLSIPQEGQNGPWLEFEPERLALISQSPTFPLDVNLAMAHQGGCALSFYLFTYSSTISTFLKTWETWNRSFGTVLLLTWILESAASNFETNLEFNK